MLSDGSPALEPSRNASEPDPSAAAPADAAAASCAARSSASGSEGCDANTPVLAPGASKPSSTSSYRGRLDEFTAMLITMGSMMANTFAGSIAFQAPPLTIASADAAKMAEIIILGQADPPLCKHGSDSYSTRATSDKDLRRGQHAGAGIEAGRQGRRRQSCGRLAASRHGC